MTNHKPTKYYLLLGLIIPLFLLTGCDQAEKAPKMVSYSKEIIPILQKYCVECHVSEGSGLQASGLDMSTYDSVMKGTKFGPVVTAGSSVNSTLVRLIDHKANPEINMPHDQSKMPQDHIETVRAWIDAGAKNN